MKTRIIQTRIWEDTFVANLPSKSKLVFIYLLTNARVELTGAYETPQSHIVLDTGLTQAEVQKALNDLEPKIVYVDGYVVIRNHRKYQDYSKGNDRQRGAYEREFGKLPQPVKTLLLEEIRLVPDQSPTSWQLDRKQKVESRNKKEGGVGETKPGSKLDYLITLPEADVRELSAKFDIPAASVITKAEQLHDWCLSKGRTYSDYKAFLRGALSRDADQLRSKPAHSSTSIVIPEEDIKLTEEQYYQKYPHLRPTTERK